MPDRYANGDPSNDQGGKTGGRSVTGYDPADPGWYHGGDLAGLTGGCTDTKHGLARLVDLGFTAIWIAPVVAQQTVQADSAAYHGYWGLDFTRVDPHFGSNEDFAAFVDCAHRLGLKVYLDVVVNHTADVILPAGGSTYRGADEVPYRDCRGKPYSAQRLAGKAHSRASPARFQPRQPLVLPQNRALKRPAWLNQVTRYHNRGNIDFSSCSPACLEQGDFFGLDDVFTEQPLVVSGLAAIYGDWVRRYKLDGFRVDTAKHVDHAFFRSWAPKVRAAARTAGVADFEIFGEVFTTDTAELATFVRDRRRAERHRLPAPGLARALRGRLLGLAWDRDAPRRGRLLPRRRRRRTDARDVPREPRRRPGGTAHQAADGRRRVRAARSASCSVTRSSTSCAARRSSTTATRSG